MSEKVKLSLTIVMVSLWSASIMNLIANLITMHKDGVVNSFILMICTMIVMHFGLKKEVKSIINFLCRK